MADKKWIGGGIYTRMAKRGPFRGQEVYYGQVWNRRERRFRHFRLGTSLRQAKKKMAILYADPEKAVAERERKAERPILFDAVVSSFLSEYRSRGNSGYYLTRSKAWLSYFAGWRVQDIDFKAVEGFREFRRKAIYRQGKNGKSKRPIGPSTLRKDLVSLGTLFRWAGRRGWMTSNPVQYVAKPPKPDREVVVLSREEEAKLLVLADPETRNVIELFLESGLRRSEGLDLLWSQVDRSGAAILIHKSKTGRARSIPLNTRLTGVLDRAIRHVRSDFVLCDREGRTIDPYVITRSIQSALERAGVKKTAGAVFNLFRHTFGSRLAERGVDMGTIATLMGNSPEICFKHYVRFSPGHLQAAMALLDQTPSRRKGTVPSTVPDALNHPAPGYAEMDTTVR